MWHIYKHQMPPHIPLCRLHAPFFVTTRHIPYSTIETVSNLKAQLITSESCLSTQTYSSRRTLPNATGIQKCNSEQTVSLEEARECTAPREPAHLGFARSLHLQRAESQLLPQPPDNPRKKPHLRSFFLSVSSAPFCRSWEAAGRGGSRGP